MVKTELLVILFGFQLSIISFSHGGALASYQSWSLISTPPFSFFQLFKPLSRIPSFHSMPLEFLFFFLSLVTLPSWLLYCFSQKSCCYEHINFFLTRLPLPFKFFQINTINISLPMPLSSILPSPVIFFTKHKDNLTALYFSIPSL